jgi:hypothetical protein
VVVQQPPDKETMVLAYKTPSLDYLLAVAVAVQEPQRQQEMAGQGQPPRLLERLLIMLAAAVLVYTTALRLKQLVA